MTVIVDITTSLDGYVVGPNDGIDNGLGDRGEALHAWVMGDTVTEGDRRVLEQATIDTGTVVMGRHLFDIIDGPHGWTDGMGYGADAGASADLHYIVVTSSVPDAVRLDLSFEFVTHGIAAAIERAESLAGGKPTVVMGGGQVCRSVLEAGLADELRLHIAPLVLGAGTSLWESGMPTVALELVGSDVTPNAIHVRYRVLNETREEWPATLVE